MTPHGDGARGGEHEQVAELLPWYANATLEADEAAQVDAHLAACAACREELARCRALSAAVRSEAAGEEGWAPSPRHFAGVLARIEASERRPVRARGPAVLERIRTWVRETPRPVRWAFAGQGAAVVALAVALLWRTPAQAPYQTLSRPAPALVDDRALLHVVVAEETTERQLRELLRGIDGVLVGGPSPRGVYTVALPYGDSDREHVDAIVTRLKAERAVRFVAVARTRAP
jgi:hypothetical protein